MKKETKITMGKDIITNLLKDSEVGSDKVPYVTLEPENTDFEIEVALNCSNELMGDIELSVSHLGDLVHNEILVLVDKDEFGTEKYINAFGDRINLFFLGTLKTINEMNKQFGSESQEETNEADFV